MAAFVVSPAATTASYTIVPGGAAVTVSITNAGGTATASFSGTAGRRISLNMSSVTIKSSKVSLLKPNGNNLVTPFTVTGSGWFLDVQTLPATGTYKIVVDAKYDNTGKMTLRLYDVPPDPSASTTTDGTPATVTTTTPGQNATLTFAGTQDQRISVELTGVTYSSAKLKIFNPDSTLLYPTALSFGAGGGFLEPKRLPATGTYTLLVDPKLLAKGSATVQVHTVAADSTGAVTADGTVAPVTTTSPGQNAYLTFNGTAGQRVSLLLGNSTYTSVKVSVLSPDSTELFLPVAVGALDAFVSPKTLPVTGEYKVFVDPQFADFGSLDVRAYTVVDQTGTISPGTPATASTSTPGQNALFTFDGMKNQRVSLNLTNVTYDSAKVSLLNPDGTALFSPALTVTPTGAFLEPKTLPATGTYTVKVDPQYQATGSMDVGLYVVPADAGGALTPAVAKNVVISAPGQDARLTYAGDAGQRISLNLTNVTLGSSACCSAKLTITKPDGSTLLSSTSFGTDGKFFAPSSTNTLTLTLTGTYKFDIDPQGPATGSVDATLYLVPADASTTSAALTSGGTSASVTTTAPGQNARVQFSAAANSRFAFKLNSFADGFCTVKLSVLRPDGSTLTFPTCSVNGDFFDTKTLATGGTYKIVVDPQGTATGTASLTLYAVPADLTGTVGSSTTVNLTPGQNARLTFAGVAGNTATVTPQSGGTINLARASFLKTNGTTAFGGVEYWEPAAGSAVSGTLTENGTHYFVLDPQGGASGSKTFGLTLSAPA